MPLRNNCYAMFSVKAHPKSSKYIIDIGNNLYPNRNNVIPITSIKKLDTESFYYGEFVLVPHSKCILTLIDAVALPAIKLFNSCVVTGSYEEGYLYLNDTVDRVRANVNNITLDNKQQLYIGQINCMLETNGQSKYEPHVEIIGINHLKEEIS